MLFSFVYAEDVVWLRAAKLFEKSTDEFPIQNALVKVSLLPQGLLIKDYVTDTKGGFSLSINDIELAFEKVERGMLKPVNNSKANIKLPEEVDLLFEIIPPVDFRYVAVSKSVSLKVRLPER